MQNKSPNNISCYLLGERAAVLELSAPVSLANQQKIWGLAEYLTHHPLVREVVPGMNNLTILLHQPQGDDSTIINMLSALWQQSDSLIPESREIEIPVHYGGEMGPDLDLVAQHAQMTAKQVVECHTATLYTVYFLGFKPGFAYMGELPECLATPRHKEPRLAVPAGSVGIGGSQTGIYPLETPGGWQIIGRTPLTLFNPAAMPPTLLRPGDSIRFIPLKEGVC